MHTATWLALQDELEKIAGVMEDAHADYLAMMKKHMHNPQVVSRLHPTERTAVFKHLNSPKNAGLGGKIVAKAGNAVATLAKKAGVGAGAMDLAGLGMLAAPTIQHMRGKQMSDKAKNRMELGGLGVLGGSVVAEHAGDALKAGKSGLAKLKGLAARMPKHAGPSMGAMMNMHRLADAAKAAKGVAKPMAQAATKLPSAAQNAARASHLGQHMAVGGHAFKPNPSRAISIPGLTD